MPIIIATTVAKQIQVFSTDLHLQYSAFSPNVPATPALRFAPRRLGMGAAAYDRAALGAFNRYNALHGTSDGLSLSYVTSRANS